MTEKQLQEAIVETARLLGWLVYHTHDSRRSAPGFPDLVLVRPPRLIFAELKTAAGQPTMDQRLWLTTLGLLSTVYEGDLVNGADLSRPCGGVESYLWRPADWLSGDVERILKG